MENQVVKTIKAVIGKDYRDFLSGKVTFADGECKLEERGGVYGVAIDLSNADEDTKRKIYNMGNKPHKPPFEQWKPIGNGFYPLYWGKDSNLGSRLHEHVKNSASVYSLQLNRRTELYNETIIYGAVLCIDKENYERKLRNTYPDIYQNIIDKKK